MMKFLLLMPMGLLFLFGISVFGFKMSEYFQPKYRKLENKVFKESEQYNDGMIRDLENLKVDYESGDADKKASLRAVIIHRFSVYDQEKLPVDLRGFYQQLKKGI